MAQRTLEEALSERLQPGYVPKPSTGESLGEKVLFDGETFYVCDVPPSPKALCQDYLKNNLKSFWGILLAPKILCGPSYLAMNKELFLEFVAATDFDGLFWNRALGAFLDAIVDHQSSLEPSSRQDPPRFDEGC